jgi:flavodoxin
VIYGSQTGNAESIAKEFNENLLHHGFNSKCLSLNSTSAADLTENADVIALGLNQPTIHPSILF